MNVPWGLVVFIVGIAYGYMSPGRQDKSTLFKKGLLWGLVIAIVLAIIGFVAPDFNPLGAAVGAMGFIGVIIAAVILTIVFILGVWLGDWIEHRRGPVSDRRVGGWRDPSRVPSASWSGADASFASGPRAGHFLFGSPWTASSSRLSPSWIFSRLVA